MHRIISIADLGAAAAFVPLLHNPSLPVRRKAVQKLKQFCQLLYPHFPWSQFEAIAEGASRGGQSILIVCFADSSSAPKAQESSDARQPG